MKYLWVSQVSFAILGLCMLGLSLRGLLSRRPIVFSLGWMPILMLVLILPVLVSGVALTLSGPRFEIDRLLPMLIILLPLVIVFRNLRGYQTIGVSNEYFQSALRDALQKLNLPFEESLSQIRLTSLDAQLGIMMQSRMGVANLSITPASNRATLKEIVQAMRVHFATVPGITNIASYVYYGLFGALMLIFTISFYRHL